MSTTEKVTVPTIRLNSLRIYFLNFTAQFSATFWLCKCRKPMFFFPQSPSRDGQSSRVFRMVGLHGTPVLVDLRIGCGDDLEGKKSWLLPSAPRGSPAYIRTLRCWGACVGTLLWDGIGLWGGLRRGTVLRVRVRGCASSALLGGCFNSIQSLFCV